MKIHEYQAKQLLSRFGIAVPRGLVAKSAAEAVRAADQLGGGCVLKAQVYAGGRGKGGGIRRAGSPAEAGSIAASMLHQRLVTPQTGPEGLFVSRLLVEEALEVEAEYYLSLTLDRERGRYVLIACAVGGVDIEETARRAPEQILRIDIDPALGLQPFQARHIALHLGLAGSALQPSAGLLLNLYRCFWELDGSLVEINPLAKTRDGRLLALDAKCIFDDSALFRHADWAELTDHSQYDPLEVRAAQSDIAYIKLGGRIGCLVNGAGLAMATLDMLTECGGRPANFLDVGGGADHAKVVEAFRILLTDVAVEGIFVNIFGGIMRCDRIAEGLLEAAGETGCRLPMVVRMAGSRQAEGRRLLEDSGLNVTWADNLADAAACIVRQLS